MSYIYRYLYIYIYTYTYLYNSFHKNVIKYYVIVFKGFQCDLVVWVRVNENPLFSIPGDCITNISNIFY